MGWASGSEIMDDLIGVMQECFVADVVRRRIYTKMILSFEMADCDTLYECKGQDPVFDSVYAALNPDEEE